MRACRREADQLLDKVVDDELDGDDHAHVQKPGSLRAREDSVTMREVNKRDLSCHATKDRNT